MVMRQILESALIKCHHKLPNSFPKYLNIAMVCEMGVPSISSTGIVPNAYFEMSVKKKQHSKCGLRTNYLTLWGRCVKR